MGCLELQVSLRKRATNYRALCEKWPMKKRHPMGLRHPVQKARSNCRHNENALCMFVSFSYYRHNENALLYVCIIFILSTQWECFMYVAAIFEWECFMYAIFLTLINARLICFYPHNRRKKERQHWREFQYRQRWWCEWVSGISA